jgi:hypothetical protein
MRGFSTIEWIAKHPSSKGKRAQNIVRFLAWQMRSSLIRVPHVFETANGVKMWAISGRTGATSNLYVGLHEFEEMSFLLHSATVRDIESAQRPLREVLAFIYSRTCNLQTTRP